MKTPHAVPRQEDEDAKFASLLSSTDARNRERDALDDYLDGLDAQRRSGSLQDAFTVPALFRRWLSIRRAG